ncbi:hypothetical protein H312_00241 [Anncaliia algerae PRA339]|uniref:Uncharacterized protein n=1 Tax=Anncaliia algerae PRA339 TaxID=1288291 RepID=A0A059F4K9_9MICR|nr:hypothetical protein H312_00241 [Anncaliia algerae PRA339]
MIVQLINCLYTIYAIKEDLFKDDTSEANTSKGFVTTSQNNHDYLALVEDNSSKVENSPKSSDLRCEDCHHQEVKYIDNETDDKLISKEEKAEDKSECSTRTNPQLQDEDGYMPMNFNLPPIIKDKSVEEKSQCNDEYVKPDPTYFTNLYKERIIELGYSYALLSNCHEKYGDKNVDEIITVQRTYENINDVLDVPVLHRTIVDDPEYPVYYIIDHFIYVTYADLDFPDGEHSESINCSFLKLPCRNKSNCPVYNNIRCICKESDTYLEPRTHISKTKDDIVSDQTIYNEIVDPIYFNNIRESREPPSRNPVTKNGDSNLEPLYRNDREFVEDEYENHIYESIDSISSNNKEKKKEINPVKRIFRRLSQRFKTSSLPNSIKNERLKKPRSKSETLVEENSDKKCSQRKRYFSC